MADDPLRLLRAEPEQAAVLLDVDGTLAPIVDRPEDARVPGETRRELARLAARYALVACVSGRPGGEVERMVEEMAVGHPSTSRLFIMMRLVGSWFAFGAPRWPLPRATNGVAAHPTIR